jgi:hypothetical protein
LALAIYSSRREINDVHEQRLDEGSGWSTVLALAAALALGVPAAQAGAYPTQATPQPRDLGAATDATITVTVSLSIATQTSSRRCWRALHAGDAVPQVLSAADARFDPGR